MGIVFLLQSDHDDTFHEDNMPANVFFFYFVFIE